MANRLNISTGAKWEDIVGYSRAVRIGNIVEVAGTTAVDDKGDVVGEDNPYEQTKYILNKIQRVLNEAGASLHDVIRTRMYVVDISRWEEIGRAHGEFFRDIKPAASMVEVKALISPELLVEIEVTAVLSTQDND
jgi:enamine deaminase RidA (YjgF/YER057c/UK114 family)